MKPKTKREAITPDTADPAVVEVAVADGLLIARSAVTVAVANRIIVHALRDQAPWNEDEIRATVKAEIAHLADEQAGLADRLVGTRDKALRSRGRSRHQFDYRPGDNDALALREAISSTISRELIQLSGDPTYVDDIVLAARDRAWNDIGGAVMSHVREVVVPDDDYDELRAERLRQLLEVDFAALSAAGRAPL